MLSVNTTRRFGGLSFVAAGTSGLDDEALRVRLGGESVRSTTESCDVAGQPNFRGGGRRFLLGRRIATGLDSSSMVAVASVLW